MLSQVEKCRRAWAGSLILFIVLCATGSPFFSESIPVSPEQTDYGSGTILVNPVWNMSLWYSWININNTRIMFFSLFSETFPSPIVNFLGQKYFAKDGNEIFIAHSFYLLEVYNDTNGNGLPDVDSTTSSEDGEILYYLEVNASQGFNWTEVTRTQVDGVDHYSWSIVYRGIQGFLLFPEVRQLGNLSTNIASNAYIENLVFAFDYSIQGNVSYLKIHFELDNITLLPYWASEGFYEATLENLSLSTLYGIASWSSGGLLVRVNGQPYDSRFAPPQLEPTNHSEILIGDGLVYEMLFGENYTLYDSGLQLQIPSVTAACSQSCINAQAGWRIGVDLMQSYLDMVASATGIPLGLRINPETSPLLYRVCYPRWSGYSIRHDPTFKAFIGKPSTTFVHPVILVVGVGGVFLLVAALTSLWKTHKNMKTHRKLSYSSEKDNSSE